MPSTAAICIYSLKERFRKVQRHSGRHKGSIGTTRFSDQVLGAKRAAQEHEFLFGDLWKPNDQIDLSQEFSPKPHESPESVIEGLDVKR